MAKYKKDKTKVIWKNNSNENIAYDLKELLKNEKFDTKPNMAKFLKTYVKSIRLFISEGKVDLWPKIYYDIGKSFVYFNDHTTVVIKDLTRKEIYVQQDIHELKMTESLKSSLEKFFDYLEQFKFIRNGHEDVKVFSTDVEKTNAELSAQISCVKEKEIQQFIDYTHKILVS